MSRLNSMVEGCQPCQLKNQPSNNTNGSYTRTKADINNIECNKKIISITRVGDRVVVMYDDCSYGIAPISVVATEAFNSEKIEALEQENKDLKDRVTALELKPDMDTIYDDTDLRTQLIQLNQEVVKKSDLIIVENLEGTADLFKAFPLNE